MKITFKNNLDWKGSIKYYLLSFSNADTDILNIDRAGRIISFISQNGTKNKITYKKAFDGTWLAISRSSTKDPRIRFHLSPEQISNTYQKIRSFINQLKMLLNNPSIIEYSFDRLDVYDESQMDQILKSWLEILDKVTLKQNGSDLEKFGSIYSNIGILPPDRYGSLVLQVTTGCVYNKCSFCTLYTGINYGYKKPLELEKHVDDISLFMDESIGRFHSIFLGDANALTIPFDDLLEIFKIINNKFTFSNKKTSYIQKKEPIFEGIYSFLDVFTGFKLTSEHFTQLGKLNLRMVYLGIETGSQDVLKLLHKPNTADKILQLVSSLHEASIGVAAIFLVGAGGKTFEEEHITESIELIKKMNLNSNDIIYLSKLFIYQSFQKTLTKNDIDSHSEEELESQLQKFKSLLDEYYSSMASKPIITRYELLDFIY